MLTMSFPMIDRLGGRFALSTTGGGSLSNFLRCWSSPRHRRLSWLGGKGGAQLVNYRVKARFYVVDRIFDVAELRLGTKHQQIVRISQVAEGAPKRRGS
ncbi:Conjugal transfer protein [Sphingobium sp. YR768]|nr:Conjugal transfer protein [Sphingobium sp. YR768]